MIKYHGTPISGKNEEIARFLQGRHALISFAAQQDIAVAAHVCQSFVLDNGAFTFWRKSQKARAEGKVVPPVDWDNYLAWVYEWHRHPRLDWWLIPDVIDGNEHDNLKLIDTYSPAIPGGVPVYHLHESFDYLRLLMSRFGRIALGSSGEWSTPGTKSWKKRMADIMSIVCDSAGRPMVKLHGLRMLNPDVFQLFPFSSADSCNAGMNCGDSDRWDGPYKPPRSSQRAEVIAWRIEHHNSKDAWSENGTV